MTSTTQTIRTLLGDFPESLTDDQVAFANRENFLTLGRLVNEDALIAARFAFERIWEHHLFSPPENGQKYAPGHRHLRIKDFLHEPDLTRLIGNTHSLQVAAGMLGTEISDLRYVGGYLHRQRCSEPWTYEDFGWPGWHQDAEATLERNTHINIWIYLDDCTRYEGVTQVLAGSCEHERQNLRDKLHPQEGIDQMQLEQDTDETGTWAEAPAGGGVAWGGFLVHRISPNVSGKPRRLVTCEYQPASHAAINESFFHESTTPEERAAMRDVLPEDKRYLLGED